MKLTLIVGLFGLVLTVYAADKSEVPEDDEVLVNHVNKEHGDKPGGWRATKDTRFFRMNHQAKKAMMGSKKAPMSVASAMNALRMEINNPGVQRRAVLPASFDSRAQWASCNSTINDIRDQGACGNCWAHSTASVISDRICITSGAKVKISVEDQTRCMPASSIPSSWAPYNDLCQGFDPQIAMRMYVNQGIVTGGEYNQQTNGCMPYSAQTYTQGTDDITKCTSSCLDTGYSKSYTADKHKGKNVLIMGNTLTTWGLNKNRTYTLTASGGIQQPNAATDSVENLMKAEIMANGPVTSSFDVYSDFMNYQSGIYQKSSIATYVGGHAIKIIGWGSTASVPYWLCVNSWSPYWGEGGLFRILRGSNHVNIEDYIVTSTPI